MSRKSYFMQACEALPGLKAVSEQFLRQYNSADKPDSCKRNYTIQISKPVLNKNTNNEL